MKYDFNKKLLNKIESYISENKLVEKGDKILIGVSGGVDSICLLHVIYILKDKLKIDLAVAHINHGIRERANIETEFVKDLCDELGIEKYILKTDIKKIAEERKISIEMAGREVRYNFFEEIAIKEEFNKIAVAHNLNDKVETILLNILRGSGIKGLISIKPKNGKIIRPLLCLERREIEEFAKANKYKYYEDESNKETIYTRNKVRLELLETIKKEYNPNIITTLNRLSQTAERDMDYLDKIAKESFKNNIIEDNEGYVILNREKYLNNDICIRTRIIFLTLEKLFGNVVGIEKTHIDDIDKLILRGIKNKQFTIGNKFIVKINSKSEILISK